MVSICTGAAFLLVYHVSLCSCLTCKFYISPDTPANLDVREGMTSVGNVSDAVDGTQECREDFQQCFVVWSFNPDDRASTKLLLQGCWRSNSKECDGSRCVATSDINTEYLVNNRFCCCSSPYCNENYTYEYVAKIVPKVEVLIVDRVESEEMTLTLIVLGIFLIMVVCGFSYLFYRTCARQKVFFNYSLSNSGDKTPLTENGIAKEEGVDNSLNLNNVVIKRPLFTGRCSTVWLVDAKGTNCAVALKLFNDGFQRYAINEIRLLSLPLMKHERIIELLAATPLGESSKQSIKSDLWLMTTYLPGGSLTSYLKASTLTWEAMLKMASSVVQAVAYLHAEVKTSDSYKPAIAHRDLKSRNILVKQDGSCVLCDFAFAVILESADGKRDRRDAILAEVGTVRYMAPELLEGAANLRDPETTLKQLDVYALGLVLWEIVSRCEELYNLSGDTVPPYELPYAKEVSSPPTLEEMQRVVCKTKKRPSFPSAVYRPKAGPLHALRELIEDCWDQDSDARITSLCASERFVELQTTLCSGGLPSLQDLSETGQESQGIAGRLAAINMAHLQTTFVGGESTTDTSRTDTSGFVSVGLGSSDRGRSCTSSLGYQTNRSDSSPIQLPHSDGSGSLNVQVEMAINAVSHGGRDNVLVSQTRVEGSSLAEQNNGAIWTGCRPSAKDQLYPLLLMNSAKRGCSVDPQSLNGRTNNDNNTNAPSVGLIDSTLGSVQSSEGSIC